MTAKLLEGKKVSEAMLAKVKVDADHLRETGINPKLAIMRVGNDPGSISYEKSIIKRMAKSDIDVESKTFDSDITQSAFATTLNTLNQNPQIHSILIFKPLPPQLNMDQIKYMLDPNKDPDSLNPVNMGKLMLQDDKGFYPCTAEGVMKLLDYYHIDLKGKDVVIVNNSPVLGKPLSMMMTNRFATVTMVHVFTKNVAEYTKYADIVVSAAGIYGLITPDLLDEKAILIDVAMSQMRDEKGQYILDESGKKIRAGDAREDCKDKVAMITSTTPHCGGGTGPITTALLAEHVVRACKQQQA